MFHAVDGQPSLPAGQFAPGAHLAGANWMSSRHPERIPLNERLYRQAFADARADLIELHAVPSKDNDYPVVWIYRATAPDEPSDTTGVSTTPPE